MHATVRSIKVKPGQAQEVARLIETEYLPLIRDAGGFVSYTLVDLGDDEVSSIGVFDDAESADRANTTAKEWTGRRLGPLVDSPLRAGGGTVLVAEAAHGSHRH